MPKTQRDENRLVAIYVPWGARQKFKRAVEDYHRDSRGHIAEEAAIALETRADELHNMIEARDKKR